MALGLYIRIPIYPIFYLLKGDYKAEPKQTKPKPECLKDRIHSPLANSSTEVTESTVLLVLILMRLLPSELGGLPCGATTTFYKPPRRSCLLLGTAKTSRKDPQINIHRSPPHVMQAGSERVPASEAQAPPLLVLQKSCVMIFKLFRKLRWV